MAMEMSLQRMADLERRVLALEERTRRSLWTREEELARKEEALVAQYGEYVDKTATAKILGVTRATVYAMLADGRILGACEGRRVDVRSIYEYIVNPRKANFESRVKAAHPRSNISDGEFFAAAKRGKWKANV